MKKTVTTNPEADPDFQEYRQECLDIADEAAPYGEDLPLGGAGKDSFYDTPKTTDSINPVDLESDVVLDLKLEKKSAQQQFLELVNQKKVRTYLPI
nr:hypothetical protein [Methylomarinum sp. Ch1-1]MDP4523141.1 hypothetical protein [Methylomarinum sp. Ch1-1]